MTYQKAIPIITIVAVVLIACSKKPKVIEAETIPSSKTYEFSFAPDGLTDTKEEISSNTHVFHKIVVQETLPTSKYVYLKVAEGSRIYWIATKKTPVEVGRTYYYRNGLLKKNFESKEYQRVFEELYLVSSIVPEVHGTTAPERKEIETHAFEGSNAITDSQASQTTLTIAELVKRKHELAGKKVTISGKCTKVNTKIMGRNWVHLKDGTLDEYDLVITSSTNVSIGEEVSMTGIVALQKDYGAGYYYDLILENGVPTKI